MEAEVYTSERTSEERRKHVEKLEVKLRGYLQSKTSADDQMKETRKLENKLSDAEILIKQEQTRHQEKEDRLHREIANCKSELVELKTRLKECKEMAKKEVNMKQAECVELRSKLLEKQGLSEDKHHHYERELLGVSEKLRREKEEALQRLYKEMKIEENKQVRELREKLQEAEQR